MPIKFRCVHCRQFLGISPSKAGQLTDCPACGRTVRVPNLDGTVAPLPAARINPGDQQLADALSALSRIGAKPEIENSSAATAVMSAPAAVAAAPRSAAPAVVAVPTQPPLPAERVAPAPAPQGPAGPEPELLFNFEPSLEEPIRSVRAKSQSNELKIAAAILGVTAVFLAGFFTGRMVGRSHGTESEAAATAQQAAAIDAPQAPAPVAAPAPAFAPVTISGVAGTVSWQTADGQTRGDGGARILAFPVDRPASPPLHVAGFRAGTVPTERERAMAEIRAAGGDSTIADDSGRYSLQLAAGRYDVLFVSRHQSRDSAQPLVPSVTELLAAYFDQPAGLVGSVGVSLVPAEFDGSSLQLDHTFPR